MRRCRAAGPGAGPARAGFACQTPAEAKGGDFAARLLKAGRQLYIMQSGFINLKAYQNTGAGFRLRLSFIQQNELKFVTAIYFYSIHLEC